MSRFTGSRFFLVYDGFFQHMTILEAVLLAQLLNHHEMEINSGRSTKTGWFKCGAPITEKRINMGLNSQHAALTKLAGRGFVEYKREGMPRRRWIKINYKLLEELMPETEAHSPESGTT